MSFSAAEVERAVGWGAGSFNTYKTKHLKEYMTSEGSGKFTIQRHILRIGEEDFGNIVSRSRKTIARFVRSVFDTILRCEFLLPLTNERLVQLERRELCSVSSKPPCSASWALTSPAP